MKRIGLVGWGYWGRNYAKYFSQQMGAVIDTVCDVRPAMLADAKNILPFCNTTDNVQDVLDAKLDGVILAVPASLHAKLAEPFVMARIPLLIEKPITDSYETAMHIAHLAKAHNSKILVGYTFLYNESVNYLKKIIGENYFGNLNVLEFKRQSYGPLRDDVNVLWDFMPHDLSIAWYLLGGASPISVYAAGAIFAKHQKEDIAVAILRYPNNVLVTINVAWMYPIKIRRLTMMGDKRMAIFEDTKFPDPVTLYDTQLVYPKEHEPSGASFKLGDIRMPRITATDPLGNEVRHFLAYIDGKEEPKTPVTLGVEINRILSALELSMNKRREITL